MEVLKFKRWDLPQSSPVLDPLVRNLLKKLRTTFYENSKDR